MKAILIVISAFLAACSSLPATVDVPIAVPCTSPPVIARPLLTVRKLTPTAPPAEVIRAYQESLIQIGGYSEQLETLLNGYREQR